MRFINKELQFFVFCASHTVRALCILGLFTGMISPALAQMSFSQSPPVSSVSKSSVLPNIILSIDDSGSMSQAYDIPVPPHFILGADDGTAVCTGGAQGQGRCFNRMSALKNVLKNTFGSGELVGEIRLAYEAMWNNRGFGRNRLFQNNHDNSMRVFDKAYQADFLNWVDTLGKNGPNINGSSTPSQLMIVYAGEYLRGRILSSSVKPGNTIRFDSSAFEQIARGSVDNPWYESSANYTSDPNPLTCRRAYFIFMTDGAWNYEQRSIDMPYVSQVNADASAPKTYYDNVGHVLPDGSYYDPQKYVIYPNFAGSSHGGPIADFAFYYWALDLTGAGSGVVDPGSAMSIQSPQIFGQITYDPAWNPKNDPATWQHMQTYTIGFGTNDSKNLGAGVISGYSPYPDYNSYIKSGDTYTLVNNSTAFFDAFAAGIPQWPPTGPSGVDGSNEFGNLYDIVHAAYNGRGRFYPAVTLEALSDAFNDIIKTARDQNTSGGIVSATASGGGILTSNSMAYVSSYAYKPTQSQNSGSQSSSLPWGHADQSTGVITGDINGWSGTLVAAPVAVNTDPNGLLVATANLDSDGLPRNDQGWVATIPVVRNIFTASPGVTQGVASGIPFEWDNLKVDDTAEDSSSPADSLGITSDLITIVRSNPLGDIVNSRAALVGSGRSGLSFDSTYADFSGYLDDLNRRYVIYVGANDGMLHGFDAGQGTPSQPGTGVELMAYVPRGLLGSLGGNQGNINQFDNVNYVHRFWVDGSLFSGDARINLNQIGDAKGWATVLVGTLGAGGSGYFVLNVTDPNKFAPENVINAQNLVLTDVTDIDDVNGPLAGQQDQSGSSVTSYIGNQFNQPVMDVSRSSQSAQIVQINSALTDSRGSDYLPEWAVIMGNGYNSASGLPVLLIQSLSQRDSQGRLQIYTVPALCFSNGALDSTNKTCTAVGNGLGAPRAIDVDGNGTVDVVYAGDLMGNLWKFDIASPDHAQWTIAYQQPLFTAKGPTGATQAITSAPMVVANPVHGGYMVAFGTGRSLTDDDATDARINSIYAVWDSQIPVESSFAIPGTQIKVPQVILDDKKTDFIPFCTPGTGDTRYASCLYAQTGGALTADLNNAGVDVGESGAINAGLTPSSPDGAGATGIRGWYYDLPETGSKVLANPQLLSNNTLLFYSAAVSAVAANSGSDKNTDKDGNGVVTETCNPPVVASSLSSVLNFFGLFTGNATDNVITINGVQYNSGKELGNRFKLRGASAFLPNGDGVTGVGSGTNTVNVDSASQAHPKSVGWRFGR